MSKPDVCETPRKAIIRTMAEARKLGYFAKFGFRVDKSQARDELEACGITQFVFAEKYYADYFGKDELIRFFWAGDGQTLVDLFRAHGLRADWEGETKHCIYVHANFPA